MMLPFRLFLLFLCIPSVAFGLGIEHPPGDLPVRDSWPNLLYESVNTAERVSGYWVNGSDRMFYSGDNVKLKTMVEGVSNVSDTKIELVLHPGRGFARSAYGVRTLGPADWSITIGRGFGKTQTAKPVRIDVWLGRNINLDDLELPAGITVKSGGEIEDFIRLHGSTNNNDGEP